MLLWLQATYPSHKNTGSINITISSQGACPASLLAALVGAVLMALRKLTYIRVVGTPL